MLSCPGQYTLPLGAGDGGDTDAVDASLLQVAESLEEQASTGASGSGPAGGDVPTEDVARGDGTVDSAAAIDVREQVNIIANAHARRRGAMMQPPAARITLINYLWN
jgi:hypothetical protein